MFSKLVSKKLRWQAAWMKSEFVKKGAPLTVCCIFKNEAPFLKEWLDFHQKQGVKKFFLIDNFSTDSPEKVLEPYLKNGTVYLVRSVKEKISIFTQADEYSRIIPIIQENMGHEVWTAFLDVDEFLFDMEGRSIPKVLENFEGEKTAAVLANWLMFGTSGVEKLNPEKPMIEQLTYRAPDDHDEHRVFKSICYLPNVFRFYGGPHRPIPKGKSQVFHSDGVPFQEDADRKIHAPLRINHYWYRSEEYYLKEKKGKRRAFGYERSLEVEERHREVCNAVVDLTIFEAR